MKTTQLKSICVYCGSASGISPVYAESARQLAAVLIRQNLALVYGGGNIGLMGILADEMLRLGGDVTGVIPTSLMAKEVGHMGLSRLHIVKDMHERKAMMATLSDAFIAMPGGLGTLEELFEMLTWSQIGLHKKPVGLLNVAGYYDGLMQFLSHSSQQGFLKVEHQSLLMLSPDPQHLLLQLHDAS